MTSSMPVLIDGDNLLHAARGTLDEAERANRAWLCRLLASWDARRRRRITVFFDGVRPDNPGDGPQAAGNLSIAYSDTRSADELIIDAVQSSSAPRRLVVVSSDRAVRTAARRRRARVLGSNAFLTGVLKDLRRRPRAGSREPREKFHGLEPGETEYWLNQLGVEADKENDKDEFGLLE